MEENDRRPSARGNGGDPSTAAAGKRSGARRPISAISRRALILAGAVFALDVQVARPNFSGAARTGQTGFEFRGISYPSFKDGVYATAESRLSLAELAKTGANYVAIIPTRFTKTLHDAEIAPSAQSEADANVVRAITDAHDAGLAVMLKPHVDPLNGKPRLNYAPADVGEWFRQYELFLLNYARMAAENRVEMFCLGCEYESLEGPRYRDLWLHVARSVRAVYSRPLVYASASGKDVSFWDAVDYIGVDAYNALSRATDPSVDELVEGWRTVSTNSWVAAQTNNKAPLDYYRALWKTHHRKPVIFTEIGYKSVAGATTRPGDWKFSGPVDLELQARAYEAFFRVWSAESSWMKGAFLWHWEPRVIQEHSAGSWRDYTPQNKPAAAVITRWYGGKGAAPKQSARQDNRA
jgi:hypothetical protein